MPVKSHGLLKRNGLQVDAELVEQASKAFRATVDAARSKILSSVRPKVIKRLTSKSSTLGTCMVLMLAFNPQTGS